ncbi:MAG: MerR family transcriptional regulator [Xanthomonadales bacterium]|nr:MerR family transcriptional regulator [Xanthomonadales bacterium]
MSETRDGMTIGALARAAEVGVETVRYYQRRGLINEPERPYGGIRRYCEPDLRRLRFIRHARDLGFSLVEAGELLQLDDGVECEQAQRIAGEKRARIQQRIEHLERIQATLDSLLEQCRDRKTARCPMIATLEAPHAPDGP